jgi:hypothetical protein
LAGTVYLQCVKQMEKGIKKQPKLRPIPVPHISKRSCAAVHLKPGKCRRESPVLMYKTKLFRKSMMYRAPCADDFPIKCILFRAKLQYVSTQLLLSVIFYAFSSLCKKRERAFKEMRNLGGNKM